MAYQYPYGDTQQLNLAWFLDEFKALQEAWEQEKQGITGALDAEIARAEAALSGVIEARDQAAASAADALAYRNAAQSASQAAELSKTNAETARRDASKYAVSAAGSAQKASNSAIAAGNSATLAESAKSTAIQQANAAVQASGAASGYSQSAGQQAANAAASATAADGSATAAAGSATTAGKEADRAEAAADEVADSVTQIATNTSDISDLKESITHIEDLTITEQLKTTQLELTWTSGYYIDAVGRPQTNSSYSYSNQIPVQEGDIVEGYMRFMTAYSTPTTAIYAEFKTAITRYVVPSNVKYIVISTENVYKAYKRTLTHTSEVNVANTKINKLTTETSGVVSLRTTGSISGANSIELSTYDIRKGMSIAFYGKVTTLGTLKIGTGIPNSYAAYFEIDDTNVKYYGSSALFDTAAHSLTFEEYIFVLIDINSENATPTITICTKSGNFQKTYSNYQWLNASSMVSALGSSTTSLTDCELSFFGNDFKKPIWYFGDSYMSFRNPARLPSWFIYANVLKNFCSIGYSGASADVVEPTINKLFNSDNYPEYIIWAIGMNNADSNGAINAGWKEVTDRLIASCNSSGITLILCTIPNTPNVDNQYKNAYVRASGLRYIDYSAAVNTSLTGTEWVDGALSSDNTHPTEIGARLLASKLIADFPEICG